MPGLTFFASNLGQGCKNGLRIVAFILRAFSGTLVMFGAKRAATQEQQADGVTE